MVLEPSISLSCLKLFCLFYSQRYLRRVSFSTQMVKTSAPPCSNILAALWPRQDDPNSRFTQNGCGASLPYISDVNHCDVAPTENLVCKTVEVLFISYMQLCF